MGGLALKTAKTRRYSKEEYEKITLRIGDTLGRCGIIYDIPKSFSNKNSFGDLDVLILDENLFRNPDYNMRIFINKHFKPTEIYHNNLIYSFDLTEFQIDFILVKPENWDTSITYFSYNDLGNLIGRISYNMGLRYGDYGLKFVYRHEDGGKKFEKIVSKKTSDIFEFLGFDWNRYCVGFNNIEDIFKFVVDSKYFNSEIFQYEKLNHQNKTRNKKRKNYIAFLEYIKNSEKLYTYLNKDEYIDEIEKYFNVELKTEIQKWKDIIDQQKKASEIFNGNVVMEYYPLRGKELGDAMKKFREYFDNISSNFSKEEKDICYSRWILDNTEIQILDLFEKVNNLKINSNK